MSDEVTAEWLARQVQDRSASGIASEVSQLINTGELQVGTRLPSVRELAVHLRVSPATVSAAWTSLKRFGSVESRGRAGTRVLGPQAPHPRRYSSEFTDAESAVLDLGLSVPDPALLPDLTRYLRPHEIAGLHQYKRVPIHAPLESAARQHWPYPADTLAALSSGYEGLLMALRTFVRPGDNVIVEEPSPPRLLDSVEHVGARLLPVRRDAEGVRLDDLERALARKPTVMVLQPGVHNPDGNALSAARADAIADLIQDHALLTIEDDGLGLLTDRPLHTLAERRPDQRRIFVRSFSKSHGPDLRLAVVEGGEREIEQLSGFWEFGARWASRILQDALARMLTDPVAWQTLDRARGEYARRRQAFIERFDLADRAHGQGLLDVWLHVRNERRAVVTLAANGVSCLGAHLFYTGQAPDFIRVSTSLMQGTEWTVLDRAVRALNRQP
ncbi:PLP-dependent aminotransferase family protein [Ornithinimicrobium sufpigmenti]|uniref:aminotransferase-like domain-containing protein n=1 Tax=Ornithinimicrobium sufpigmenti TaxID=2508882 RepID=UPI0010358618|nr:MULTISPECIES: PLP-dependent aminotransferase family protein [unclassified Ornithinimicrobium]